MYTFHFCNTPYYVVMYVVLVQILQTTSYNVIINNHYNHQKVGIFKNELMLVLSTLL